MTGWRTKFFFMLVIYFAGFATAVYIIGPTPKTGRIGHSHTHAAKGGIDSQEVVCAVNTGLHKAADFGKEMAARASVLIKERVEEMQARKK